MRITTSRKGPVQIKPNKSDVLILKQANTLCDYIGRVDEGDSGNAAHAAHEQLDKLISSIEVKETAAND